MASKKYWLVWYHVSSLLSMWEAPVHCSETQSQVPFFCGVLERKKNSLQRRTTNVLGLSCWNAKCWIPFWSFFSPTGSTCHLTLSFFKQRDLRFPLMCNESYEAMGEPWIKDFLLNLWFKGQESSWLIFHLVIWQSRLHICTHLQSFFLSLYLCF